MNGLSTLTPECIETKVETQRASGPPRFWLYILVLVLCSAITFQLLPYPKTEVVKRGLPLEDYLPRNVGGWESVDHPLGDTEAVTGAVQKILNYDEAVLREYRKDSVSFFVYVAYWHSGKMPAREIAFHIPDKCWPANGWTKTSANYAYTFPCSTGTLAPAQYREFVLGQIKQNVIYWHMFNGRPIIYNPNGSPSDWSMLTDLLHRGLRQKGEQYFIRVSSSSPLENLWKDGGMQSVVELLAALGPGLTEGAASSPN